MSSLRLESRQYKAKGIAMITLKIDDIPSSNNKYIVFGVIYRGEE